MDWALKAPECPTCALSLETESLGTEENKVKPWTLFSPPNRKFLEVSLAGCAKVEQW